MAESYSNKATKNVVLQRQQKHGSKNVNLLSNVSRIHSKGMLITVVCVVVSLRKKLMKLKFGLAVIHGFMLHV